MVKIQLFDVKTLVLLCLFLIVCWEVSLWLQHPTEQEINLEKRFVSDCKDQNCYNDWSEGWQLVSLGAQTQFKSGPPSPDYNSLTKPYLALTVNTLDCNLIETQGFLNYYNCV